MNGIACLATGGNLHEKFSISSHRMGIGSRMEKKPCIDIQKSRINFSRRYHDHFLRFFFSFFFLIIQVRYRIFLYYSLSLSLSLSAFFYIFMRTMKIF